MMTRVVELSEAAYAVVCGMVQDSEDVNEAGVIAPTGVWTEVRQQFPLTDFWLGVKQGEITYDRKAGT